MAQSSKIQIAGGLVIGPSALGQTPGPSIVASANLGLERKAAKRTGDSLSVVDGSPLALPFGGITAARFVYIRVLGSALLTAQVMSSLGVARIPIAGMFLWDNPVGPAITAITLEGTGDFEYQIAGA
jgi:hypothetical protein